MIFQQLGMVDGADYRFLFVDPPGNPSWIPTGAKGERVSNTRFFCEALAVREAWACSRLEQNVDPRLSQSFL